MYRVREIVPTDDYVPETYFDCPSCKALHKFYSTSPNRCKICDLPFPPLSQLKKDQQVRIRYHRYEGNHVTAKTMDTTGK